MTKIFVVEDEAGSLDMLVTILRNGFPDSNIKTARTLAGGKELFTEEIPDIAVLDVEYPDGTGFDLLRSLTERSFPVVFVSGYEKYAIEAFRFSAIDYILKPFERDSLLYAVRKGLMERTSSIVNKQLIETLLENYRIKTGDERQIVLSTQDEMHVINTSQIIHCVADNNYTTFYFNDRKPILVSKPIKEYEDLLGNFKFMRVHQSHLINLKRIKKYDKRDGGQLVMTDNSIIPVAIRKKPLLMNYFASLYF